MVDVVAGFRLSTYALEAQYYSSVKWQFFRFFFLFFLKNEWLFSRNCAKWPVIGISQKGFKLNLIALSEFWTEKKEIALVERRLQMDKKHFGEQELAITHAYLPLLPSALSISGPSPSCLSFVRELLPTSSCPQSPQMQCRDLPFDNDWVVETAIYTENDEVLSWIKSASQIHDRIGK